MPDLLTGLLLTGLVTVTNHEEDGGPTGVLLTSAILTDECRLRYTIRRREVYQR